MDISLIDKLSLNDLSDLESRDKNFRIVINHKIYDTSHEDDIARYIINDGKFSSMLLIRFEYYLSKSYHGLGKGDMVFYDKINDILYTLELKSLKDKYSSITDTAKIKKCIDQSIKYSEYTINWGSKESIPVSVIELNDGKIQITERITSTLNLQTSPWTDTVQKRELEDINNDKWFNHPGDQTLTKYRINGDTLESERIVDYQPSSGSRRSFRKRVNRVCQETTKCTKYLCILKDIHGAILMQEYHEVDVDDQLY
jgi:hypothetical protein